MVENHSPSQKPLFVGDDLALDFLNSEFGTGQAYHDCFTDDGAVFAWLKLAGVLDEDIDSSAPDGLMALALQLRSSARSLISAARQHVAPDLSVVNDILRTGSASNELQWDNVTSAFKVVQVRQRHDAASFLEPIARAIAQLLTDRQLGLIRECEAHDCTLMFHDKTKSHRRRWCSMALCGNRMKVAAFRSRQKQQ